MFHEGHDISLLAFVVKVLESFMLNPIGLLLRDVFTGFSEAPVEIKINILQKRKIPWIFKVENNLA